MDGLELAPINVEIVPVEDLGDTPLLAKVDRKRSGIDFRGKADAVLGHASDILEVVDGVNLYKVEVPDGYNLKSLVASTKDPDAVRALVKDPKGHLNGDVSLKASGISPAQIASLGLAAAAMVVGQAYMTEISDSLHNIDEKLDTVAAMIAGEQKAKIKNALDIARSYVDLYDDYQQRPTEALQAARTEIERKYNDVGDVVDWITEQLADIEKRAKEAKSKEKDLEPLLSELHSYEDQFSMCLQALSALAMTRMYYDGAMDERSASVEQQRILDKSQGFLRKRQTLTGILEMKIGTLKGTPIALPRGTGENALKRLVSQTPRAAAKQQLLEAKISMQADLREAQSRIRADSELSRSGIGRIASVSRSARNLLTDGTTCWLIDDVSENQE